MANHYVTRSSVGTGLSNLGRTEQGLEAAMASTCAYAALLNEVKGEDLWGVHAWRVVTAAGAPRVALDDLLP